MLPPIPAGWKDLLEAETGKPYYRAIDAFLARERADGQTILPAREEVYSALEWVPFDRVKVLLLGQDPYPTPGDAHGLCFSVRRGRSVPRSLRNVYKELAADVGFLAPDHGNLEAWARQGILLLNTVLTVRANQAFSHRQHGWETFTDRIIEGLNTRPARVVFLLWGKAADRKRSLITQPQHAVVSCAHPSPLSARFFLGSRCFSAVNRHLQSANLEPIDWQIPNA